MKFRLGYILIIGLLVQVFSTQGILTFNFFNFFGKWEMKSYLHPIGVLITLTYFFLYFYFTKRLKFNLIEVLFFLYSAFLILVLSINVSDFEGFYLAFRDVFLIFILTFCYCKIELPTKSWHKVLGSLRYLVIANILFLVLTYILGPEKYMEFTTGRFSWPIDEEYKFKISNIYFFWRSPGLIGEAAGVGYFGLLCYFLFEQDNKFSKSRYLPLILVIFSFVRSVYLVLLIYFILKFITKKKNIIKIESILPYLLPTLLLLAIPLYFLNLLSIKSVIARMSHWINDLDVDFNFFLGGAIGEIGSAARGLGFVATLDSYWLLMLMSAGIVGIVLTLLFFLIESRNNKQIQMILISFLFTGFFITLTQAISFLVLFPMLFIKKIPSKKNL